MVHNPEEEHHLLAAIASPVSGLAGSQHTTGIDRTPQTLRLQVDAHCNRPLGVIDLR